MFKIDISKNSINSSNIMTVLIVLLIREEERKREEKGEGGVVPQLPLSTSTSLLIQIEPAASTIIINTTGSSNN